MKKEYDESQLINILAELIAYASQCSEGEKRSYLRDLAETGFFHDAIGKVLKIEDGKVLVTEEY